MFDLSLAASRLSTSSRLYGLARTSSPATWTTGRDDRHGLLIGDTSHRCKGKAIGQVPFFGWVAHPESDRLELEFAANDVSNGNKRDG